MTLDYSGKNGILLTSITLHEVTQGYDALTMAIPLVPPTQDPGGGGWEIPPIYIPPITIPGGGWLNIFHNGVFVCAVTGINFLDDD
jgi:hypothetical protein